MTRYKQGFMNKCAEYGMDEGTANGFMKQALFGGLGVLAGNLWLARKKWLQSRRAKQSGQPLPEDAITGGIHSSPQRDWGKVMKDRNEIITGGIHSPQTKLPWPVQPPTNPNPNIPGWSTQPPSYPSPTSAGLPKVVQGTTAKPKKPFKPILGSNHPFGR